MSDVMKLVGIAIISTILCMVIKKDRPEMAMFIGVLTGIMILLSVTYKLNFTLLAPRLASCYTQIHALVKIVIHKIKA